MDFHYPSTLLLYAASYQHFRFNNSNIMNTCLALLLLVYFSFHSMAPSSMPPLLQRSKQSSLSMFGNIVFLFPSHSVFPPVHTLPSSTILLSQLFLNLLFLSVCVSVCVSVCLSLSVCLYLSLHPRLLPSLRILPLKRSWPAQIKSRERRPFNKRDTHS